MWAADISWASTFVLVRPSHITKLSRRQSIEVCISHHYCFLLLQIPQLASPRERQSSCALKLQIARMIRFSLSQHNGTGWRTHVFLSFSFSHYALRRRGNTGHSLRSIWAFQLEANILGGCVWLNPVGKNIYILYIFSHGFFWVLSFSTHSGHSI